MNRTQMRKSHYSGEWWTGPAVYPDLWELLLQKDLLIEITTGSQPYRVVLGAPHHAAPQVDQIAENWTNPRTGRRGRPADETTGLTGPTTLTALQEIGIAARLLIAAHPTDHDPNKSRGCPY